MPAPHNMALRVPPGLPNLLACFSQEVEKVSQARKEQETQWCQKAVILDKSHRQSRVGLGLVIPQAPCCAHSLENECQMHAWHSSRSWGQGSHKHKRSYLME